MNSCIRITAEDNSKPYLFYEQSGYWNIEFISQKENASGYIVQEVKIINTTGIPNMDKVAHYYEAWCVSNGKCVDDEDDIPDDSFKCGSEDIKKQLIKLSLGKTGEIKYICKIYWIDETNTHFKIVDNWKERGVIYAAKLKSVWVNDCPQFAEVAPVCEREVFIHKVNFVDKEIIKDAIIDCYINRIKAKDELLQFDLMDILYNSPYENLIEEICIENNLAHDMV